MIFYSISFLVFFILFSVLIQYSPTIKTQHIIFLVSNVIFYAYWDYRFLVLLFAVIAFSYWGALKYSKSCDKKIIWICISVFLIILGIFKYFNFFIVSFSKAFGITDHVSLNLVLPLGISFYLFQAMSYLFDVMYKRIEAESDFLKIALYISFFPQITSGPIVKSKDFLPQLGYLHRIKGENFCEGIQLFLIGLTKKIVFADRIAVAVDAVYRAPEAYNWISVLFAVIGYSFQIYCDFSGYSNMAIGIAKIWDFDLGENFNAPYIAKNPSDFWRRWHISLSTWFRDYVYIPLGGSRKGEFRTYFNLFITMVLSGIWHGANSTFIIWGIVHGIASVIHKKYNNLFKEKRIKIAIPKYVGIAMTFIFVSFAWIFFRANSLDDAMCIIRSLFNIEGLLYINIYVVVYICILSIFNYFSLREKNSNVVSINLDLNMFRNKLIITLWIWLVIMFMYCGNSSFIYAQF